MAGKQSNKVNLFFLECVCVIGIFAMVSVGLVQAFARVHRLSSYSTNQIQAMIQVSNVAEQVKALDSMEKGNKYWYYDELWKEAKTQKEATFVIELKLKEEKQQQAGELYTVQINASHTKQKEIDEQEIWGITFKQYLPEFQVEPKGEKAYGK